MNFLYPCTSSPPDEIVIEPPLKYTGQPALRLVRAGESVEAAPTRLFLESTALCLRHGTWFIGEQDVGAYEEYVIADQGWYDELYQDDESYSSHSSESGRSYLRDYPSTPSDDSFTY